MTTEHVHDCTGPEQRCNCGFVFAVPPVSLAIDVCYRGEVLFDQAFMCDSLAIAAAALRKAADTLEMAQASRVTQTLKRMQ